VGVANSWILKGSGPKQLLLAVERQWQKKIGSGQLLKPEFRQIDLVRLVFQNTSRRYAGFDINSEIFLSGRLG
jgi:hypothetical protein